MDRESFNQLLDSSTRELVVLCFFPKHKLDKYGKILPLGERPVEKMPPIMKKTETDVAWAIVTDETIFNYYAKVPAPVNKPTFLIMRRNDRAPLIEFVIDNDGAYTVDNFQSHINSAKIERHRTRSAESEKHDRLHEAQPISHSEVSNFMLSKSV
jgi:hypothetical protein